MLTNAQLATLKAAIVADSGLNALPNTADAATAIADAFNATASPDFIVWKTDLSARQVKSALVWTEFIARSPGEQAAFTLMIADGAIDPSDPNIRQGIADCFSGAGGAATRSALLAKGKRKATRAEKLFATGTGTTQDPAVLVVEGDIDYHEVRKARTLP